jgi:hypothetical protein
MPVIKEVKFGNLKVKELTPTQIEKFSWWRCDQLYEKHESWGSWGKTFLYR